MTDLGVFVWALVLCGLMNLVVLADFDDECSFYIENSVYF